MPVPQPAIEHLVAICLNPPLANKEFPHYPDYDNKRSQIRHIEISSVHNKTN